MCKNRLFLLFRTKKLTLNSADLIELELILVLDLK